MINCKNISCGDIFFWCIFLFLSGLTAIVVISDLCSYKVMFTMEGVNNFKNILLQHGILLGATITMITVYIGYRRLKVAEKDNKEKIKESRFLEWSFVLDSRLSRIKDDEPFMVKTFPSIRRPFFDLLYDHKFNINNKETLEQIFQPFVDKGLPLCFEHQNPQYISNGDNNSIYSFSNFRYIFLGSTDMFYQNRDEKEELQIVTDLETLYKNAIQNHTK